ncbi:MAG: glycosyltransferase family 8 protein [Bacteroidetes bacterium]|nr:glycosyltransferase family 8 protein [Bacteroidota bacterium]
MSNAITIFTVCDNHFTVLLAALIKSIEVNHHSDEHVNLYIVGDKLTPANKKNLEKCAESEKFSFFWIEIKDVIKDKSSLPLDGSSFPLIVYIRLFFPLFLPPEIDKVIYLDVDMIVRKDISVLWQTDLGDKIIAGVPDRSEKVSCSWGGIANYAELGIDPDSKYFNSGLLMMSRRKWVASNITEKIIDCIAANKKYANFPDQYGLNVVFANQWMELDRRWNSYSMIETEDPYLIHFIGIKPIFTSYSYVEKYKTEFYRYLEMTPWAGYKPIGNYVRLLKKVQNKVFKKGYRLISSVTRILSSK